MLSLLLTCSSYFVGGVVVYYAVLFCVAALRRDSVPGDLPSAFIIFVAALNEEAVIAQTVSRLLELDHDRFVICVGNDGSEDRTAEILAAFDDPRLVVVNRALPHARNGKSDVLNDCMSRAVALLNSDHAILGGLDASEVIVGIVDADGRLDEDTLEKVSPYFADSKVASVQIGVRIENAATNLLTRMQDMEFVGFSAFVQKARDHIGSSGLGGNGQFTRLSALVELKAERGGPWQVGALTEDLELGLALICQGWKTRYCPSVYVAQQGLPSWPALFRQRTRWIQGHYRCWSYLRRLASAPTSLLTRLDLSLYLLLIVTVIIVTANAIVGGLTMVGVVSPHNSFLAFLPEGVWRNTVSLTFGLAPLVMFMYAYQRNAARPFRFWEVPAAGFVFTLYTYVWILATARALARNLSGRGNWVKTPRVADTLQDDALPIEKLVIR